ncbi:hypothetical protein [Luteibacter sp. CQ10]|uniref:hypothetical protein n=1 Tax=Luteibacter sp. CQ10 TaxID=2805821 RepID=UPI0034A50B5A
MTASFRMLRAVAFAWWFLPWAAVAHPIGQRIVHDDRDGSVTARVLAAFDVHADAAQRWYSDALAGMQVGTRRFSAFSRPWETATFASFTYTFNMREMRHVRVYHARSGHNEPLLGVPGIQARHPYRSYFDASRPESIAWDEPVPDGSDVTNTPVEGDRKADARQRDAELKVARLIEADIRAGRIAAGGELQVYASQAPCDSCRRALQALSDRYDVRIHVSWLGHGSPAYLRFQRMRHQRLSGIQHVVNGGYRPSLEADAVAPGHLEFVSVEPEHGCRQEEHCAYELERMPTQVEAPAPLMR